MQRQGVQAGVAEELCREKLCRDKVFILRQVSQRSCAERSCVCRDRCHKEAAQREAVQRQGVQAGVAEELCREKLCRDKRKVFHGGAVQREAVQRQDVQAGIAEEVHRQECREQQVRRYESSLPPPASAVAIFQVHSPRQPLLLLFKKHNRCGPAQTAQHLDPTRMFHPFPCEQPHVLSSNKLLAWLALTSNPSSQLARQLNA
eukprot:1156316-Pelagomonas_calceolata.AAC.5